MRVVYQGLYEGGIRVLMRVVYQGLYEGGISGSL